MGCHFLLQGIVPTQGSKQHLPHWQEDSLPLSRLGSPWGSSENYSKMLRLLNPGPGGLSQATHLEGSHCPGTAPAAPASSSPQPQEGLSSSGRRGPPADTESSWIRGRVRRVLRALHCGCCQLAFPGQRTRPHTQLHPSTLTVLQGCGDHSPSDQLPSDLGPPDTRWRAQPPRSGEHQELS